MCVRVCLALSLVYVCVWVCVCVSLSLSLYLCVFVCVSLSVSVRVSVCACLSSVCPSLRLFRLVGETFGCKQVCGDVFVWHKTTTMHLIFCRRMLLLFSWRRRAWKERCSLDCFYNGTAARAAAACLTGLTRLTDTSAAANMTGLLEEEGISFSICCSSSRNTNAKAMQVWWDLCCV